MIISEFSNNIQGPSKIYSFDYYHGLPGEQGPQGIQGEQGIQGIQGIPGETGAAAGFGTPTASATLLPSGSNPTASVTASGTDTAKIFDFEFGIPAADTSELEERVEELEAENAQQAKDIAFLKYANEGKTYIMEESDRDGYSVDVKPATVTGEAFGEAVLKSMEGRDVCWNQLSHTLTKTITISEAKVNTWLNAYAFDTDNLKSSHKYFGMPCAVDGCVYQHPANGMRCSGIFDVLSAQESIPYVGIFANNLPAGTYTFEYALIDLTLMFPTDTPTSLSDPRITWLKAYLAEHPEYNAGAIVNNNVTSVVSEGANLYRGSVGTRYPFGRVVKAGEKISVRNFGTDDVINLYTDTTGDRNDYFGVNNSGYVRVITLAHDASYFSLAVTREAVVKVGEVAIPSFIPYFEPKTLSLPSICSSLHGLPSARDRLSFVNRVYENMKAVDLSTLAWGSAQSNRYYVQIPDLVHGGVGICDTYGVQNVDAPSLTLNCMNVGYNQNYLQLYCEGTPHGILHYEATSGGQRYEARVMERKVGMVDIGSLSWSLIGSYYWVSSAITDAKRPASNGVVANILSSKYETSSAAAVSTSKVSIGLQVDGCLQAHTGDYSNHPTGTLHYELATPQLLDITSEVPEEPSIAIEDGGTLTFVNENKVATPSRISMPVKLGGTV